MLLLLLSLAYPTVLPALPRRTLASSSAPTMATEADAPAVGTRFSQGPHRGTVRYVGEVPSTRGIWLGVEWDDAGRGKHDGTHDGVRYFACRCVKGKEGSMAAQRAYLPFPQSSGLWLVYPTYGKDFLWLLVPAGLAAQVCGRRAA